MHNNSLKRTIAGILSMAVVFTSSGLSSIGTATAADVPDDYPVQMELVWDETDAEGDTLSLTPYDDSSNTETAGSTAKLVLSYTLGSRENEDGVQEPLKARPGDIEIRLPAYIFKNRSGNGVGNQFLGISTAKTHESGFYYAIDTKDTSTLKDDEIVIKNYTTITGDQTFRCDILYWSGQAHAVKDGYTADFHASSTIRDGSVIQYQKDSNTLTVSYHTNTEIVRIDPVYGNSTYPKLYKNWKSTWGTKPSYLTDYSADHMEGYVYIAWPVSTVLAAYPTQPGTISKMMASVSTNAYTVSDVVAVTRGSYTFSNTSSLPTSSASLNGYQAGYIITAHKASELENAEAESICITMDASTSFTGVDGCTSSAQVTQTYNYESLEKTSNGDMYNVYKYAPSPNSTDTADGLISLLEISDFGEVLPLKTGSSAGWDFVMTGEAANMDELTASYVVEESSEPAEASLDESGFSNTADTEIDQGGQIHPQIQAQRKMFPRRQQKEQRVRMTKSLLPSLTKCWTSRMQAQRKA